MGRPWATWLLALALLVSVVGGQRHAFAQTALDAPLLDGSHARRAHALAADWVRQAQAPEQAETAIEVTGLIGVRVTLRIGGIEVGAGEAYRPDIAAAVGGAGPAVDLVPLLASATRQALAQVMESLRDAQLRAAVAGMVESDTQGPELADVADRLLVDLQLAHRLEPVQVRPDADAATVFGRFAPGFHGLRTPDATRPGDGVVWPATALARNLSPRSQVTHLLDAAGVDPRKVELLGRPGGVALQRFEVIHLVRPLRTLPVTELVRGSVVLPPHNISGRTLDAMARRLAGHLERRFTLSGAVRGTYHPTSNRYQPELAGDQEAALACYALTRYALRLQRTSAADEQVHRIAVRVRDTTQLIGRLLLEQPDQAQAAAAALILLTLTDDQQPDDDAMRDRLGQLLMTRRNPAGGFRETGDAQAPAVNEATHALAVAALASLYQQTRDPAVGQVVTQELDHLWARAQAEPNIAALPWFVLAHSRAARTLAGDDPATRSSLQQRERGLGDLVVRLCEQQVIEPPRLGPPDVIGGFELVRGPVGSPPNPDWRTAQLLSFLALSLRSEGITQDRDTLGWLLTAGLAGRFLGQLMMDEPNCYYVRSVPDTLGGVRLALYDNRLAVAPQAMTLLAVVELQETLDRFTPAF